MTLETLIDRRSFALHAGRASLAACAIVATPAMASTSTPEDQEALLRAYWTLIHLDERLLREREIARVGINRFQVPMVQSSVKEVANGDLLSRARLALA